MIDLILSVILVNLLVGVLIRAFVLKPDGHKYHHWIHEFIVLPVYLSLWPVALWAWGQQRKS
jgi:hypothetical protein